MQKSCEKKSTGRNYSTSNLTFLKTKEVIRAISRMKESSINRYKYVKSDLNILPTCFHTFHQPCLHLHFIPITPFPLITLSTTTWPLHSLLHISGAPITHSESFTDCINRHLQSQGLHFLCLVRFGTLYVLLIPALPSVELVPDS